MKTQNREMLACWANTFGLQVRIPKQRGGGFLQFPCWHSHQDWMHRIGYDVEGLDGWIDIDCGYVCIGEEREGVVAQVMPILKERFGFGWRVVLSEEFWRSFG